MSTSRTARRRKKKEIFKEAKEKVKNVQKVVNNSEKKCSVCEDKLDVKSFPEQLDSWHVEIYEDYAKFYCDKCFVETPKDKIA
jgi:hypothetical protein